MIWHPFSSRGLLLLLRRPNRRTYSYSEPQLYSQNSGGNYFDTQGSSSQVSTVVTSHGMTNNGGGGSGGMSMNMAGGQVISSSPGAYIMDNAGPHPATQSTRASPATVSFTAATNLAPPNPHSPACFCVCFQLHSLTSGNVTMLKRSRYNSTSVTSPQAQYLLQCSFFKKRRIMTWKTCSYLINSIFHRPCHSVLPSGIHHFCIARSVFVSGGWWAGIGW